MGTKDVASGEIRVVSSRVFDGRGGMGFMIGGGAKRRGDEDWVLRGESPAFGMIGFVGNRGGAFQGADIRRRRNGGEEEGVVSWWGGEAEE